MQKESFENNFERWTGFEPANLQVGNLTLYLLSYHRKVTIISKNQSAGKGNRTLSVSDWQPDAPPTMRYPRIPSLVRT